MEYINTFLNLSAFTEAKPNLPKPSLSLIENTNQVYYIKKPLIFEATDTDFSLDQKLSEYNKRHITFKLKRSFVADDTWYTICLPFNVAQKQLVEVFGGEKVELRTFDHIDGTVMYFKSVENLEAGVPYLIKPNKNTDTLIFEDVIINLNNNPSRQIGADGYFMQGTYQATVLNTDGTNLFLSDNNTFFRPSESEHRMKGFRVYFIVPKDVQIPRPEIT